VLSYPIQEVLAGLAAGGAPAGGLRVLLVGCGAEAAPAGDAGVRAAAQALSSFQVKNTTRLLTAELLVWRSERSMIDAQHGCIPRLPSGC